MPMRVEDAIAAFQKFCGSNLTQTLSEIEWSIRGVSTERLGDALEKFGASGNTFAAAGQLKEVVGQLNVVIHALGILLCLPHVMEPGEVVEYVSLGAGNTGRSFDLETDRRVAEFKFIRWQGGAEAIRQNSLFKDFYLMAEHPTPKKKCLYVLGTHYPLKFLNAGRAIKSVLSRHVKLMDEFTAKYGSQYATVRDYYQPRKALVSIEDVSPWLAGLPIAEDEPEAV
jgi:hypothetical protein